MFTPSVSQIVQTISKLTKIMQPNTKQSTVNSNRRQNCVALLCFQTSANITQVKQENNPTVNHEPNPKLSTDVQNNPSRICLPNNLVHQTEGGHKEKKIHSSLLQRGLQLSSRLSENKRISI